MPGKRAGSKPPGLWLLWLAVVIAYAGMFLLILYVSSTVPH